MPAGPAPLTPSDPDMPFPPVVPPWPLEPKEPSPPVSLIVSLHAASTNAPTGRTNERAKAFFFMSWKKQVATSHFGRSKKIMSSGSGAREKEQKPGTPSRQA